MQKLRMLVMGAVFMAFFGSARLAHAQGFDVFGGLGTATDKSSGQTINTFGDGVLYQTPSMGGLFGTAGGTFMLRPSFGVGAEISGRFTQGDYAGLKYRPKFYDFNAVWLAAPASSHIVPELQAGVGGANLRFYYGQRFCSVFSGCSTSNSYLESSNHFQGHFGAGLRFYAKGGIYVKPQFDLHYVKNFFQFHSNWVPQYGVTVGYTFGRR